MFSTELPVLTIISEKSLIKLLGVCSLPLTFLHCYTQSCMRNNNSLQFVVRKHVLIFLTFLYWANQSCNLGLSPQKHEPSLKSSRTSAEYIASHFLRLEIRWIAWLKCRMTRRFACWCEQNNIFFGKACGNVMWSYNFISQDPVKNAA